MKKNILIPVTILALFFTACNNASTDSTASTDTMNHEGMDHNTAAAAPDVPPVPEGARIYFSNLKDGQEVTSPLMVEMGIDGMSVDSAAHGVKAGSGHHHLLIDDGDSLATGTVVPKDSTHLHFGNAQTHTEVTLAPGEHKLTLQFADGLHRSYGGRLATSIMVNVKK